MGERKSHSNSPARGADRLFLVVEDPSNARIARKRPPMALPSACISSRCATQLMSSTSNFVSLSSCTIPAPVSLHIKSCCHCDFRKSLFCVLIAYKSPVKFLSAVYLVTPAASSSPSSSSAMSTASSAPGWVGKNFGITFSYVFCAPALNWQKTTFCTCRTTREHW